jgi:hypothetical protein
MIGECRAGPPKIAGGTPALQKDASARVATVSAFLTVGFSILAALPESRDRE